MSQILLHLTHLKRLSGWSRNPILVAGNEAVLSSSRVTTFLQLSIGVSLDAVSLGLTRLALPSTSSLPPSDLRSLTGPHSAGFMNKEAILDRLDS
jgi:hypothetical protein